MGQNKPLGIIIKLKVQRTDGSIDDPILYCHQETTTIGASTYYLLKKDTAADAAGTTLSVSAAAVAIVVWGKFVFQLTGIVKILAATVYAVYHVSVSSTVAVINGQIDIIIRNVDNGIRQTIDSNVSVSATTKSTSFVTLTGANYSFAEYVVVNTTDYLELDFKCNVATAKSGALAYLRIDDNTLAVAAQTGSPGWDFAVSVPPGAVYLQATTGRRTQLADTFSPIKIDPTTGRRGLDPAFTKFLVRESDGTLRAKSA